MFCLREMRWDDTGFVLLKYGQPCSLNTKMKKRKTAHQVSARFFRLSWAQPMATILITCFKLVAKHNFLYLSLSFDVFECFYFHFVCLNVKKKISISVHLLVWYLPNICNNAIHIDWIALLWFCFELQSIFSEFLALKYVPI